MPRAQPLRRSKRLRYRPLRYAEVGTLTFKRETLLSMKRAIESAREQMKLANVPAYNTFFFAAQALEIILNNPGATAYYPLWRGEVSRFIYKHEREIYSQPCWAQALFRAYWQQYPPLFHHPLWRDASE